MQHRKIDNKEKSMHLPKYFLDVIRKDWDNIGRQMHLLHKRFRHFQHISSMLIIKSKTENASILGYLIRFVFLLSNGILIKIFLAIEGSLFDYGNAQKIISRIML